MRVPRFILSELSAAGAVSPAQELIISGEEAKHLRKVLRKQPGDTVEIYIEATGDSYLCEIAAFSDAGAHCTVKQQLRRDRLPEITLCAAVVAKDKCDFIVEKAVEIGAAEICFFFAARSQERFEQAVVEKRLDRWQRISAAALKQSGTPRLPRISAHADLPSLLAKLHPDPSRMDKSIRVVCCAPEHPGASEAPIPAQTGEKTDLLSVLETGWNRLAEPIQASLEKVPQSVDSYILIGPEGGFIDEELEQARRWTYVSASLGPNVLRAETAATLALGVFQLFWFSKATRETAAK
ncbi:MAG: RsmE family RNA methyltransferase [Bdellovibrionota bacterium]